RHPLFSLVLFCYYCLVRDLSSFPTRRSSDLVWHCRRDPGYSGLRWRGYPELGRQHTHRDSCQHLRIPDGDPKNPGKPDRGLLRGDRKSTRLNSSHVSISYAVFCLKKKKTVPD